MEEFYFTKPHTCICNKYICKYCWSVHNELHHNHKFLPTYA